jgi:hypothetical protein
MIMLSLRICLVEDRKKNSTKLVDNQYFTIVIPHDPRTARLYCADTKWCIASRHDSSIKPGGGDWLMSFDDYKATGHTIAVVINKQSQRRDRFSKIAFVWDRFDNTSEWYDALNNKIEDADVIRVVNQSVPNEHAKFEILQAIKRLIVAQ